MRMTRRDLAQTAALGLGAMLCGASQPSSPAGRGSNRQASSSSTHRGGEGLTRYVVEFILNTTYARIPNEVIELGKKSILDGFGLAFSGSVAASGNITRTYLASLGLSRAEATVIGSGRP